MRIKSAPKWAAAAKPELLLTDTDEYWASAKGNIENQAFVFELDLEPRQSVAGVEWKAAADSKAPARLSLEAKSGEEWQHLGEFDSLKANGWQARALSASSQSKLWKLTFIRNHGSTNYLEVSAVRFMVRTITFRQQLWLERRYADVKVVSGSLSMPVHRAILATASPTLAALLEKAEVIQVVDVGKQQSVQDFLEYLYTEDIAVTADFGVVVLAHKYGVKMLAEEAAPQALKNLSPESVVREISLVKPYAKDAHIKPIWEALMNKVREDPTLFDTAMSRIVKDL